MITLTGEPTVASLFSHGYPTIKRVIYEEYANGFTYEPHIHEYAEIVFCISLEGDCTDWVNGTPYHLQNGSLTILNAGQLHETVTQPGKRTRGFSVVLEQVHLFALRPGQIIPDNVCPVLSSADQQTKIRQLFEEIYRDYIEKDLFYHELAQLNLAKLICYIYRSFSEHSEQNVCAPESLAHRVQCYIDQHIQDDLNLERLGELFFTSPYLNYGQDAE